MTQSLYEFIDKHEDLIASGNLEMLYNAADPKEVLCTQLTEFLVTVCGIDPLDHMSYVPSFYCPSSFTEVEIPENIVKIQSLAFYDAFNLKHIQLPQSLTTLGKACFESCLNLREITLPRKIIRIPVGAFMGCSSLQNITLNEGLQIIGEGAFMYCEKLSEITIPDSVEYISRRVFCHTALKKVNFSENSKLLVIDDEAFNNTRIEEIRIPESVDTIHGNPFSHKTTVICKPDSYIELWCKVHNQKYSTEQ